MTVGDEWKDSVFCLLMWCWTLKHEEEAGKKGSWQKVEGSKDPLPYTANRWVLTMLVSHHLQIPWCWCPAGNLTNFGTDLNLYRAVQLGKVSLLLGSCCPLPMRWANKEVPTCVSSHSTWYFFTAFWLWKGDGCCFALPSKSRTVCLSWPTRTSIYWNTSGNVI